uniref:CCHC-type domain-containing protein n=1 Tax=Lygus hesperus TaxID=30085 RepID=A0A0K8TH57_LYGHE
MPPPTSETGIVGSKDAHKEKMNSEDPPWLAILEAQNRRYEALIQQLLLSSTQSQQKKIPLPSFDPKTEGIDPNSWIRAAECCFGNTECVGGPLVVALSQAMKGEAASWFTSVVTPDLTWDNFKSAFVTQWGNVETPAAVFLQFLTSQPRDKDENYATYASRMVTKLTSSWKELNHEQIAVSLVLGHLSQNDARVRRVAYVEPVDSREKLLRELSHITYKRTSDTDISISKKTRTSNSDRFSLDRGNPFKWQRDGAGTNRPSDRRQTNFGATSTPAATQGASGLPACYICKSTEHFSSRCPKKGNRGGQGSEGGFSYQNQPTEKTVSLCQVNPVGTLLHNE